MITTQSPRFSNRRSRPRRVAALLSIAAAALAVTACDGETAHPPRNDVSTEWTCTTREGLVRATGTITNHSSKTSFYQVQIEFRVGAEVVDERGASVDGVAPGETTRVEVVSDVGRDDVTCHLASVDRFKA